MVAPAGQPGRRGESFSSLAGRPPVPVDRCACRAPTVMSWYLGSVDWDRGHGRGYRSRKGGRRSGAVGSEQRLNYRFRDRSLLQAALTHASGAEHRLASNERLEFLGDAILGAIVCELIYRQYPEFLEGDLTKIKSVVVSRQTCAKISEALGLEEFLILGKGMTTHPSVPSSLLADVFESLLAAMYLDGGIDATREFVLRHIGPEIESTVEGNLGGNYKSILQQLAQRQHGTTPIYQLLDEKGPSQQVLQGLRPGGKDAVRRSLGPQQEEAEQRGAKRPQSTQRRASAVSVRLTRACPGSGWRFRFFPGGNVFSWFAKGRRSSPAVWTACSPFACSSSRASKWKPSTFARFSVLQGARPPGRCRSACG